MSTPEVLNSTLHVGPLKATVAPLSKALLPEQEDMRPLQSKWGVEQTKKAKPRHLAEVFGEVGQRVVNVAQKLHARMENTLRTESCHSAGKLVTVVPTSGAQPNATCIASAAVQFASTSSGKTNNKHRRRHPTPVRSGQPEWAGDAPSFLQNN